MSSRNIRKYVAKNQATKQQDNKVNEDDEAADFEPTYTSKSWPRDSFFGLRLSSSSDGEDPIISRLTLRESSDKRDRVTSAAATADAAESAAAESDEAAAAESDEAAAVESDEAAVAASKLAKNKNNRKKKQKNKRLKNFDDDDSDIDNIVAEVNDILGSPSVTTAQSPTHDGSRSLLKIDHKYLNVRNEVFGPNDEESRRNRRRQNHRLMRRQIIMTQDSYEFTVRGLSMRLIEIKNDVKYFKFDHGSEYQKHMHHLVNEMKRQYDSIVQHRDFHMLSTNTVEALLNNLDLYLHLEESGLALTDLEEAISFMQRVFDPAFNYLDGKCRLEYKHVENRVFHIALLKYLHILTNKACHRTALELAKLLLNLDPSDPLGVIFIVDTLALRAREHQWLVNIYKHWADEKDAARVFHLSYSHALAMYHLYLKNDRRETLEEANKLIKFALVKYPSVSLLIMQLNGNENEEIKKHEMFTTLANQTTSADLKSLQFLYVKFVAPKWREQNIMNWLITNALDIIERFNSGDRNVQESVRQSAVERSQLFRKHPLEIKRHLSVISTMSNLLVEGAVPLTEPTLPFNPFPSQGTCVDVHRYYKQWGVRYEDDDDADDSDEGPGDNRPGVFRSFIASLVPDAPQRVE